MARPTTYDLELGKEICLLTYDMSLTEACNSDERFPARSTFFLWKRENKELSDFYVNIMRDKGVLFIEEINEAIEELKKQKLEPAAVNVIVQTLKWKAAKFYPKMFGEKIDIKSGGKRISNEKTVVTFVNSRKDKETE